MSQTPISAIREGLAINLGRIRDVQISAYLLASPTPPALHIFPQRIDYDRSMQRGLDVLTFTVEAFVALGLDQGAQMRLDEMLSPTGLNSVKESVEIDRTLGQLVQDVRVVSMSAYRVVTLPEQHQVLSADWTVLVNT